MLLPVRAGSVLRGFRSFWIVFTQKLVDLNHDLGAMGWSESEVVGQKLFCATWHVPRVALSAVGHRYASDF